MLTSSSGGRSAIIFALSRRTQRCAETSLQRFIDPKVPFRAAEAWYGSQTWRSTFTVRSESDHELRICLIFIRQAHPGG